MAAASVLSQLRAEFEEAQKGLKDVDENIKRLTGRDPDEFRNQMRRPGGPAQGAPPDQGGRDRYFGPAKGRIQRDPPKPGIAVGPPPPKRRIITGPPPQRTPVQAPTEDSGEDEELPRKGGVQSSVVAAPTAKEPLRTRRDATAAQKGDRRCMERNRRMFGMMLGTLQKFQSEETRRKDQVQSQKRAEIEQKLEEAAEREKAELRKERQNLFLARRQKQQGLRRLELKMEVARLHEEAEARQRLLLNFIHTKTKPHIMFKPAKHTPETQKRLKESQKRILAIIESRRAKVKEELDAIDELYHRDNMPAAEEGEEEEEEEEETAHPDKENRGPASVTSAEGDEAAAATAAEGSGDSAARPDTAEMHGPAEDRAGAAANGKVTEQAADGAAAEPMDTTGPETASSAEQAHSTDRVETEAEKTPGSSESAEESAGKQPAGEAETMDAASEEGVKADDGAPKEEAPTPVGAEPSINTLGDEKFEPIYDE